MKRWWQSKTVQNALLTYLIAITGIIYNSYQRQDFTQADVGLVLGATYTLTETIKGRARAEGPLGKNPEVSTEEYEEKSTPNKEIIIVETSTNTVEETTQEGELSIDLLEIIQQPYKIRVLRDTKIKTSDNDSDFLSLKDYQEVKEGETFSISSWKFIEMSNHIKVWLDDEENYFLYVPHIKLLNSQGHEISIDSADPDFIATKKTPLKLPGYNSIFYLEDPILPKGHFFWREATKNGTRIPESKVIVENILALASDLEEVRSRLGNKPITITSWYRPPAVNRAVGGASRSKHLTGSAADIVVRGMTAPQVQDLLRGTWKGGLGTASTFTHLDLGPRRTFGYG